MQVGNRSEEVMAAARETEPCGGCRTRMTAHVSGLCSRCLTAWPEAPDAILDDRDIIERERSRERHQFPLGRLARWMP